jgi:hypothetical protein
MKDLWSDLHHFNGGFMSQHNPRVESDNFDPHIIPAETAARKEREQENYKHPPKKSDQDIDSTGGYTVDQEGLVNNFAIEPEMYVNEPGDLRDEQQANNERRKQELHDANQTDEEGKLTMQSDNRSKGVGQV